MYYASASRLVVWPIAVDSYALKLTVMRVVIVHRTVLRQTVVPDRHGVRLPAEAAPEAIGLHVLVERCEERGRLGLVDTEDARGEEAVDEKRLAATLWVSAHDRVDDGRVVDQRLLQPLAPTGLRQRLLEAVLKGVLRLERDKSLAQRLVERIVSRRHREELGVATPALRNDDPVQNRAHWRACAEGHVGVPSLNEGRSVGIILEYRQLRIALNVRVGWVRLDAAKALREVAVVLRFKGLLISKEDDLVFKQRLAYGLKL